MKTAILLNFHRINSNPAEEAVVIILVEILEAAEALVEEALVEIQL